MFLFVNKLLHVLQCRKLLRKTCFYSFLSACGYPFPSSQSFMIEEQTTDCSSIVHAIIPKLPTSPTFLLLKSICKRGGWKIESRERDNHRREEKNSSESKKRKAASPTSSLTTLLISCLTDSLVMMYGRNKSQVKQRNHETANIFLGYKGTAIQQTSFCHASCAIVPEEAGEQSMGKTRQTETMHELSTCFLLHRFT